MQKLYAYMIACLLFCTAGSASAQWNAEAPSNQGEQQVALRLEAEQAAANRTATAATDNLNRAALVQQGNQNTGVVNQQYTGAVLSGNIVNLTQAGDANSAVLNQTGSGLRTDLTQQGSSNQVQSDLVGNNTTTSILQDGLGNQVTQQLLVDDRTYRIQQQGNNNVLEQRESGAAAPRPGYDVRMVGDGIRIRVEQGIGLPMP